ncbi:MAG: hypothetical protein JNK27_16010 [Chitinophagaceae bacterium]|nr:hypothetical protein [Chitinophagaceae bacterium]
MKKQNNTNSLRFIFTSCGISWHRSLRRTLVLSVFMAAMYLQVSAQTETFDIVTYTPPKNWSKDAKPGVMNYMNVNKSNGGFCIIAMFASKLSTGDAQKDFTREWNELVATPYKVEESPKPETQSTADGWEIVAAAAPAKVDGADVYIFLTVISGHGKSVSIRSSLNDEAYLPQMTTFLESIDLDKTKSPTVSSNTINNVPVKANNAGSAKFGLMTYSPPVGWSHQQFQDGVVFKPLDLPQGEHLAMQIMQPLNFGGSLEQALQQSFDEAAAMYNGTKMNYLGEGNYKKEQAKQSFRGWEYIRCNGGVRIGGGDYPPEYGLDLFVIKINNRFERVAVLKSRTINRSCSMSSFYADDRQPYKTAINNFLFSLQFTDGSEPLLSSGTTDGGGIMGVWQGISMQTSASSGLRYNVYSPIFLSNGQAYFGSKFYSEGLDGLDTRIPPELYHRDWGTYSFSNGRGVLKMPYADIPLRMEGNTLIITANQTDHKFYSLSPVDGARFNGTYVMSEAYGKIPVISFTADGRFTDNGAVKVLYHEYNECINPALNPGSGTYEVKDYTITFNYSDGRKIKIAFLGTEYDIKNQSPAVLRMSANEDPMVRQ